MGVAENFLVFSARVEQQITILLDFRNAAFKTISGRIIPEPFFVHSDLTTGIQIADLVAYIILWGFRTKDMVASARKELDDYVKTVRQLRHRTSREIKDNPEFIIWSICVIKGFSAKDSPDELE